MKKIVVTNEYFEQEISEINSIITFNYDFESHIDVIYHFVFTKNNRYRASKCCIGQWNVKCKTT